MKQWQRVLLELLEWHNASASELARYLGRDPSHVYRDLMMLKALGYTMKVEAIEKNPDAMNYFSRKYGSAKGLQFRWRITERGKTD